MPNYRRSCIKGGTFFFTVVTYNRCPIFADKDAVNLLKDSFERVIRTYPFEIDSIVILPDHLHCIWTLAETDSDFSVRWRFIKANFTRNYVGGVKDGRIWQRRFWEHMIRNEADLNTHRDYIHYNPVKHGFVDSPAKWEHSSFKAFVGKGMYPADWGDVPRKELLEMDLE